MPTTQMQVRSFKISASLSQSGSVVKSLIAMQIVLNPSQAIGSITFRTISSRSLALKTRGWPETSRTWEHLTENRFNNHSKLQLLHFALHEEEATKEKTGEKFLGLKAIACFLLYLLYL